MPRARANRSQAIAGSAVDDAGGGIDDAGGGDIDDLGSLDNLATSTTTSSKTSVSFISSLMTADTTCLTVWLWDLQAASGWTAAFCRRTAPGYFSSCAICA